MLLCRYVASVNQALREHEDEDKKKYQTSYSQNSYSPSSLFSDPKLTLVKKRETLY